MLSKYFTLHVDNEERCWPSRRMTECKLILGFHGGFSIDLCSRIFGETCFLPSSRSTRSFPLQTLATQHNSMRHMCPKTETLSHHEMKFSILCRQEFVPYDMPLSRTVSPSRSSLQLWPARFMLTIAWYSHKDFIFFN